MHISEIIGMDGYDKQTIFSWPILHKIFPEMGSNLSEQFDGVITNIHIAEIARDFLSNWESLSPYLGLSRPQEKEISKTYSLYGDQKRECLNKWKEEKGKEATYRAFIDAAEKAKNKQLADNVREMLQAASITRGEVNFCKGGFHTHCTGTNVCSTVYMYVCVCVCVCVCATNNHLV